MQTVINFVTNHPGFAATVAAAAESVIMPFVPIKWNGLAMTIFSLFKKKAD